MRVVADRQISVKLLELQRTTLECTEMSHEVFAYLYRQNEFHQAAREVLPR